MIEKTCSSQPTNKYCSNSVSQLREAMINGSEGSVTATVKKFYNKEFNKVYKQRQTYYYAPISNTPYRYGNHIHIIITMRHVTCSITHVFMFYLLLQYLFKWGLQNPCFFSCAFLQAPDNSKEMCCVLVWR